MSEKMKSNDPAYWLLERGLADPSKRSTTDVYREGCYICDDPEFGIMGLPLCKACPKCDDGHVAADDCECDRCGYDLREEYFAEMDKENAK